MKSLSPQKKYLLDLYSDGEWKCSTAIQFVRDFRKRFSEMREAGYEIESMRCDGRCGQRHTSAIHMYRITSKPTRTVFDYVLKDGMRVPVAKEVPIL